MPLYEYQCGACGHRFEQIRKFSDPPVELCPSCGELKVQKLLSSPAIMFKGSGFYINDYARKGSSGDGSKSEDGAKGSSQDGKPSSDTPSAGTTATASASSDKPSGGSTTSSSTPSASATAGSTTPASKSKDH